MNTYTIGQIITHDGDEWRILGLGAKSPDRDSIYAHLASTTRFRPQKNGMNPIQMGDWLPLSSNSDLLDNVNYVGHTIHY